MASAIISNDRIEKLNSGNYRSWKYNIKMALMQRELWDHVTGDALAAVDDNEDIDRYNKRKEKALATIALSVDKEQQEHILDCVTAKEAWETLKKIFEPQSRPRILQLKKEMVSIQLKQDETMTTYLARIKACNDSLKEAGYENKDEDLAYAMLAGLPESYDGIMMSLANLNDAKFTSTEIRAILVSEYDRREARGTKTDHKHKEAYHQSKENPQRGTDRKKEEKGCFRCGKQGHIARYCRTRLNDNVRNNYKPNAQNNYKGKDSLLLELNNIKTNDTWILDSGATNHVCRYRNRFHNYKSIDSERIYSADSKENDELKAIGIGDVDIETIVNNDIYSLTLRNVYYVPNLRRNLMSISQIEAKNKKIVFDNGTAKIINKETKRIVGAAHECNGLYVVVTNDTKENSSQVETNIIADNYIDESKMWHQRFCHVNVANIRELSEKGLVRGLENVKINNNNNQCKGCNTDKSTKVACKKTDGIRTKGLLELIHADLCGPLPVE